MGFTEILTLVFIVLKLLGEIDWTWWLVLLPELIATAVYVAVAVVQIILVIKMRS